MLKKPHILYWKWNEDVFEEGVLEKKTYDIINRSMFDYLYVSFHFTSKEHKILVSDELIRKIEICAGILEENNRHLLLDLDIRTEKKYFETTDHAEHLCLIQCVCGTLDNKGNFRKPVKEAEGVLKCWAVERLSGEEFSGTPLEITEAAQVQEQEFVISAGEKYADYGFIGYVFMNPGQYDVFGEEFKKDRRALFERVKHIKPGGVAQDEWGASLKTMLPLVEEGKYDPKKSHIFSYVDKEIDLSVVPIHVIWLNYSDGMEKTYMERYGRPLIEDLLYIWHYPEGERQKSIDMVNRYLENIRLTTARVEEEFYALGKEYFGEDCFIACHPTYWGDELDNSFDCAINGLDWWEAKRDYAQTDEEIIMPIRLAMMRKCPENVWYNMWYSMRTMDIRTYYRETWINARYGGRTHHLGYECNEPNVVLELYPDGMLESISEMEEKIEEINKSMNSRPDSKVLVLFGYEACTNWKYARPGITYLERRNPNMHKVLSFTKELFLYPYLCELAPTSEIDNDSICLTNGKVTYMGHEYDAVLLLQGEGMSEKAYDLIKEYGTRGGKLLVAGEIAALKGGKRADMNFPMAGSYDENVTAEEIAGKLLEMEVPQMCGRNYCCYEDGSIIYTTDGEKNVNNPLKVEMDCGGKKIEIDCLDYFIQKCL